MAESSSCKIVLHSKVCFKKLQCHTFLKNFKIWKSLYLQFQTHFGESIRIEISRSRWRSGIKVWFEEYSDRFSHWFGSLGTFDHVLWLHPPQLFNGQKNCEYRLSFGSKITFKVWKPSSSFFFEVLNDKNYDLNQM